MLPARNTVPQTTARNRSSIRRKKPTASEASWASVVESWLDLHRWRWWHVPDSRRMKPGLLDYVCLRPGRCVVFDLKIVDGRVSPEQKVVLELLATVPGVESGIFTMERDWPALRDLLL